MTCFTCSTSTANWSTDKQLRSVCTTTFATFRCTKSSPGSRFTISFAGTRLSEQPIHRYSGACCAASSEKNRGRSATILAAQRWLLAKRCSRSATTGFPGSGVGMLTTPLLDGNRLPSCLLRHDRVCFEAGIQPERARWRVRRPIPGAVLHGFALRILTRLDMKADIHPEYAT